jgi:hypothetical protein
MHDLNVAADALDRLPLLPVPAFGRHGSLLRNPSLSDSVEAGASKRPFARPQRLSVSGPPLRGHRFRPASSTPRPPQPGPFDPGLRPLRTLPRCGGLHRPRSVACALCWPHSKDPQASAPLWDLPSRRIIARPGSPPKGLPRKTSGILRSPTAKVFILHAAGSTFRIRFVSEARCSAQE